MHINKLFLYIILILSFILPAQFWNTHFAWDEITFQKQTLGILEGKANEETGQYSAHPLLYTQLISIFYLWFPKVSNEIMSHLISAVFGTLVVLFTFLLARLLYNEEVGLIASAIMAVLPIRVLMSRMFMLDIAETLFFLCTMYFLFKFVSTRSGTNFIMLFLFANVGLLFKFPGTLLALPLIFIVFLVYFKPKEAIFYTIVVSFFGVILAITPTFFGGKPPVEFYGTYVPPVDRPLDWLTEYFKYFFMGVTPLILAAFPALFIDKGKRLKIALPLVLVLFILLSYNFDYLYESTYAGPFSYSYGDYNSLYFDALLLFSFISILIFFGESNNDRFLSLWFIFIFSFYIITLGIKAPAFHIRRMLISFPALIILVSVGIWKIKKDYTLLSILIIISMILSNIYLADNLNAPTSSIFESYYDKDVFLNNLNTTKIIQHQYIPSYYSNLTFVQIPNTNTELSETIHSGKVDYIVYSQRYSYAYPSYFKYWELDKNPDLQRIKVFDTQFKICDPLWFRFWIDNLCVNRSAEKIIIYKNIKN